MFNFKKIFLSIPVIFCLLFVSCSEESDNPVSQEQNFTYPFNLSSSWYFGTKNFITNIRPDSIRAYFTNDTTTGYGGIIFLGDTVIFNDTLRLMRNNHSDPQHFHSSIELYKQTNSGLYRHAYFSEAFTFTPYRNGKERVYFKFRNKIYFSPEEILTGFKKDTDGLSDYNDSVLIIDTPPLLALKYPIVKNDIWLLKEFNNTKIFKQYLDYENINISGHNYYCMKIKKSYYFNNSGTPDENILYFDYFSKEGIVKKELSIKNISVFNKNAVLIGYIDTNEEDILNIFSP